jgi:hypothetical protein
MMSQTVSDLIVLSEVQAGTISLLVPIEKPDFDHDTNHKLGKLFILHISSVCQTDLHVLEYLY